MLHAIEKPAAFIDKDYRLRHANREFCRLFGISTDNGFNEQISNITGEVFFLRHLKPHLDRCLEGKETRFELPFNETDQTGLPSEGTCLPHFNSHGQPEGTILIHGMVEEENTQTPASQKKRWHQPNHLHEVTPEGAKTKDPVSWGNEKQFLLLAENATDLIYVMNIDQQFTYISPSVKKILGYEVEEALGLHGSAFLTDESYQRQLSAFKEVLEDSTDYSRASDMMELELIRKDGTTIWGEAHARLILDDDGNPKGIFGICRDITKRKKVEQSLRDKEQKFRMLAEHSTDLLYTQDLTPFQKITYVSPSVENLLGYKAEEVIGMPVKKLLTPESFKHQSAVLEERISKADNLDNLDNHSYI